MQAGTHLCACTQHMRTCTHARTTYMQARLAQLSTHMLALEAGQPDSVVQGLVTEAQGLLQCYKVGDLLRCLPSHSSSLRVWSSVILGWRSCRSPWPPTGVPPSAHSPSELRPCALLCTLPLHSHCTPFPLHSLLWRAQGPLDRSPASFTHPRLQLLQVTTLHHVSKGWPSASSPACSPAPLQMAALCSPAILEKQICHNLKTGAEVGDDYEA